MNQFFIRILFFIMPIIILLFAIPINKRLQFQEIKDDCNNHGIWIYDRINSNINKIDFAFVGSSRTINSINDKLINKLINNEKIVTNLGYCRFGRDLHYSIINELIKKKKPKYIFLEIREDENRFSHPIFPFIANETEILFATPFFNIDIVSNYYNYLSYKLELVKDKILKQTNNTAINYNKFGYGAAEDTINYEILKSIIARNETKNKLSNLERNFHMNFSRIYLDRISRLCKNNNIELNFIYLPSYGTELKHPNENNTYKKYGKIIFPPNKIFIDPNNWYDKNHLNKTGGKKLSIWLSKYIKKHIK